MALRRVTRTFEDLATWFAEYPEGIGQGALLIPAGTVDGELAPEVRVDLIVPLIGRVGPITGQVVHRGADGSVALRLPKLDVEGRKKLAQIDRVIEEVREWLLSQGDLQVGSGEADDRDARIEELEQDLQGARQLLAEAEELLDQVDETGDGEPRARRGRGFRVPDLRGVPPTIGGSMTDRSLRDAMVQLAVDRVTGLLTVTQPDGTVRYGFWSKGGPVGWRTEPMREDEVLGVLLYRAKQVTKEQLQDSLQLMEQSGQRQGEAFIEMNVMTYPQLIMVLGKQVEYLLQRVMSQRVGEWTFHVLQKLPERFLPVPLPVPTLLFRALFQHMSSRPAEEIGTLLRPKLDRYLSFPTDVVDIITDMKLNKLERKLIQVMSADQWRTRELFSVSPLSRAKTTATLLALDDLGFLQFDEREDEEKVLARNVANIKRKRLQTASASHFDILEVHWICLPHEVEQAHKRLTGHYDPARFANLPPESLKDLETIRERLDQAHAKLKPDRGRREYRRDIIEEDIIVQSAELLGKQGEMAIMRHDRRDATACYGKALELVPRNPAYRDGLQRATTLG